MNPPLLLLFTTYISTFHLSSGGSFSFEVSTTTELSFNFTTFTKPTQNITYEQSAFRSASDNSIHLTQNTTTSFGRATYAYPLPLWDPQTRNLAHFRTHFTFTADGSGLAFFLAPSGSKQLNSSDRRFVAVEFDPAVGHVGIDINSMESVRTVPWGGGRRREAWISYNSTLHRLSVTVKGFGRNDSAIRRLSYVVDLRDFLPREVTFGFSAATTAKNRSTVQRIHSWDFASSLEQLTLTRTDTNRDDTIAPSTTSNPTPERKRSIVGVLVGLGITIGVLFAIGVVIRQRLGRWEDGRKHGGNDEQDVEQERFNQQVMDEILGKGAGPRKFTFNELAIATNNFDDSQNKLGEGGFGGVYRGYIYHKSEYIAVKRVSRKSKQGIKEFAAEVKIISRLRHRNLVQLIGWCYEKMELLLVYEFLPNGSLDTHLFKSKNPNFVLTWETRFKIAKGLASALFYLHEEWEQCVVHRDIKSSNVMLDSNFNTKLGDFGLARLVDHDKGSQTTLLAGTMGYLAPECATTGKTSRESDMYSFGVVILEIATGRKPAVFANPEEEYAVHLAHWVWDLYGDGKMLIEGPDSKLNGSFDEKEMERLMLIGLSCAHPNADCRPSIRQALQVLNLEAPAPELPLRRPVATYVSAPSMAGTSDFSTMGSSCVNPASSNGDRKTYSSCEIVPSRMDNSPVNSFNVANTF